MVSWNINHALPIGIFRSITYNVSSPVIWLHILLSLSVIFSFTEKVTLFFGVRK